MPGPSCRCPTSANNVLTAADCSSGEIYVGAYGCIPAASCTNETAMPKITSSNSQNSGAHSQTDTITLGGNPILGDVYSVTIASIEQGFSQGSGESLSSIASRIAAFFQGKPTGFGQSGAGSCSGGPKTMTATASGNTVKITHHICNGPAAPSVSRTSPSCSASSTTAGGTSAGGAAPPACNYDSGGLGRVCSSNSDCCSGLCSVAGDQPFMTNRTCAVGDASCTIGPKFVSNYASPGGKDPYGTGGTKPSGGVDKITPVKVCVPSGTSATYTDYVKPPAAVSTANLNKKLVLNDGSYLRCYLEADDVHRNADGCSCKTGYEAVILSSSDYNSYNTAMIRPTKLDVMWAQIQGLILQHPKMAQKVGNAYDFAVSNANAYAMCKVCVIVVNGESQSCCSPGQTEIAACGPNGARCTCNSTGSAWSCVTPSSGGGSTGVLTPIDDGGGAAAIADIYSDETSPTWRTSAPQGYGQSSGTSTDKSATDAVNAGAGMKLTCVKKCDGTTLGRDPDHPLKCLCPDGAAWDSTNYTCKTCYSGAILDTDGNCVCPQGYTPKSVSGGTACRPVKPSEEYTDDADGYPVCGSGRVPMTYQLKATTFSSQTTPKTKNVALIDGKTYPYASPTPAASPYPVYYYQNLPHCGCTTVADPGVFAVGTAPAEKIVSVDDSASGVKFREPNGLPSVGAYGMVSIALDSVSDGRKSTTPSKCGCPNVNEKPAIVDGKTVCQPEVDVTDPNMRFATFDPVYDDVPGVVLNDDDEIKGTDGKIVSQILLPANLSSTPNSPASTKYTRGIWKCADGYTLKSDGKCFFDKTKHTCSSDSAVSDAVSGGFNNVVNKKLACCLNGFPKDDGAGNKIPRFDCIENANQTYSDFDALWKSSDPDDTGGQMNAFVLTNASKKPVTGFYTLNGVRCAEYSEFTSDTIQPGKVNPAVVTAQMNQIAGGPNGFQAEGSAISKPSGAGFSTLVSKLGSKAKAPSTAIERRRCPILVRAALIAGCPENPQVPNASIKTVEDKGTSPALRRCSVASSLQVKVRVEQVWQIAGQPKMVPIDTVLDAKSASQISVSKIISHKYGNQCPPGTKQQGDACVY